LSGAITVSCRHTSWAARRSEEDGGDAFEQRLLVGGRELFTVVGKLFDVLDCIAACLQAPQIGAGQPQGHAVAQTLLGVVEDLERRGQISPLERQARQGDADERRGGFGGERRLQQLLGLGGLALRAQHVGLERNQLRRGWMPDFDGLENVFNRPPIAGVGLPLQIADDHQPGRCGGRGWFVRVLAIDGQCGVKLSERGQGRGFAEPGVDRRGVISRDALQDVALLLVATHESIALGELQIDHASQFRVGDAFAAQGLEQVHRVQQVAFRKGDPTAEKVDVALRGLELAELSDQLLRLFELAAGDQAVGQEPDQLGPIGGSSLAAAQGSDGRVGLTGLGLELRQGLEQPNVLRRRGDGGVQPISDAVDLLCGRLGFGEQLLREQQCDFGVGGIELLGPAKIGPHLGRRAILPPVHGARQVSLRRFGVGFDHSLHQLVGAVGLIEPLPHQLRELHIHVDRRVTLGDSFLAQACGLGVVAVGGAADAEPVGELAVVGECLPQVLDVGAGVFEPRAADLLELGGHPELDDAPAHGVPLGIIAQNGFIGLQNDETFANAGCGFVENAGQSGAGLDVIRRETDVLLVIGGSFLELALFLELVGACQQDFGGALNLEGMQKMDADSKGNQQRQADEHEAKVEASLTPMVAPRLLFFRHVRCPLRNEEDDG
jgi:hypothetical protein